MTAPQRRKKKPVLIRVRQEAFCQEYLRTADVRGAAISAGYSEQSAQSIGAQLLQKKHILERIETLRGESQRAALVTRERIIEELAALAGVSLRDYYVIDADGTPRLDLSKADAKAWRGLESITDQRSGRATIRVADRLRAYQMLIRMLGFDAPQRVALTDTAGHDVSTDIAPQLLAAMTRALGVGGAVAEAVARDQAADVDDADDAEWRDDDANDDA